MRKLVRISLVGARAPVIGLIVKNIVLESMGLVFNDH